MNYEILNVIIKITDFIRWQRLRQPRAFAP